MIKSRVAFGVSLFVSMLGVACGDSEGGPKGASCEAVCERIEDPQCGNAAPNCVAQCKEEKLNTPTDCQSEIDALTSCFAGATFHCDGDDVPQADACKPELDRWIACSEQPSTPDDGDDETGGDGPQSGGESPGDHGEHEQNQCGASPADDACDSCLKGTCCDETSACGPACQRIADCVDTCADDDCIDECVNDNLDGAYQFSQLATCMVQSCAGSCNLGS
ncbi:MAG: hypothetical protein QM778_13760 [Myxococcales bacterium]